MYTSTFLPSLYHHESCFVLYRLVVSVSNLPHRATKNMGSMNRAYVCADRHERQKRERTREM